MTLASLGPPLSARDRAFWAVALAGAATGVVVLALTVAFVAGEASLGGHGAAAFLWRAPWSPLSTPPSLGIGHALRSTLLAAGAALAGAVPLGVAIAVFTAELAPAPVRAVLQPALELLAGIPAVVFGFFGYLTISRGLEQALDLPTGECLLAAAVVLAMMVLPFVASTATEALRAVPAELRHAAYGLGATRAHLVRRVILPRALPGLFAAVALGLARALSETLAVLMLSGNSVAPPASLLDRGQPLTALLATELGEAAAGTPKHGALFGAGLVLLAVVLALNAGVWVLRRRALALVHG